MLEDEIAATTLEISTLKREIISFGDDLDAIKLEVGAVDREYRAAQAENQVLLEQLRAGNLDPIEARMVGVQLASILVYLGSLTTEITLEGQKVRRVSRHMFAKEAKIHALEQKQMELEQLQQEELEKSVAAENQMPDEEEEKLEEKPVATTETTQEDDLVEEFGGIGIEEKRFF